LKDGDPSAWGIIDVGDKSYVIAIFRSRHKAHGAGYVFRAYEFDKEGVLYVSPISQWDVECKANKRKELARRIYSDMAECIASEYYSIAGLRDIVLKYPEDIVNKLGTTLLYGYCA